METQRLCRLILQGLYIRRTVPAADDQSACARAIKAAIRYFGRTLQWDNKTATNLVNWYSVAATPLEPFKNVGEAHRARFNHQFDHLDCKCDAGPCFNITELSMPPFVEVITLKKILVLSRNRDTGRQESLQFKCSTNVHFAEAKATHSGVGWQYRINDSNRSACHKPTHSLHFLFPTLWGRSILCCKYNMFDVFPTTPRTLSSV